MFAIAITLLALELKIPHSVEGGAEGLDRLQLPRKQPGEDNHTCNLGRRRGGLLSPSPMFSQADFL